MARGARRRGHRPARRRERPQRGAGPRAWVAVLLALGASLVWSAMPVAALTAHVPAPDRPASAGFSWVHVAGGRIVDDQGRTILLRGFDSDTLLEPATRHSTLDEQDAVTMQRAGFDVVRLPLSWALLEPVRGTYDTAYLDSVVTTVRMLERHGLRVVLNMHIRDWSPRFGGSGAPDWAALPLVPDLQWWPWESWRRHLSPAVNAAQTYFWLSPDWQDDFARAWSALAERFRDDAGLVGYDLYNEPHPLPIPPPVFEKHWLWPFYARTIERLGAVDPNHLFMVEGSLFGDFGTTVVPLAAPDLVYSSHLYTGALVPPAFTGDRGPLDRRVAGQLDEAAHVPAPLGVGELGIDHAQAHAAGWADAALDAYDDAGVGWAWWQWRESPNWGIVPAAGDTPDLAFLRHLARPYLVAAPPGVGAGRGDGVRGTLDVRVGPPFAGGEVVVSWPALTLGTPRATGDCVTGSRWDPAGARLLLTLSATPGCSVEIRTAGSSPAS